MKLQDILPVVLSILVIILVAVLEKQSRLIAALTASMPITMPLAMWIIYSSSHGDKTAISQFNQNLVYGLVATLAFVIAAWLSARAGLKLGAILGIGYGAWGITTLILLVVRRLLGIG